MDNTTGNTDSATEQRDSVPDNFEHNNSQDFCSYNPTMKHNQKSASPLCYRGSDKKPTDKKDTEKKDTEKKDTEKKDTEKKDTEKKDTEKKVVKSGTESGKAPEGEMDKKPSAQTISIPEPKRPKRRPCQHSGHSPSSSSSDETGLVPVALTAERRRNWRNNLYERNPFVNSDGESLSDQGEDEEEVVESESDEFPGGK